MKRFVTKTKLAPALSFRVCAAIATLLMGLLLPRTARAMVNYSVEFVSGVTTTGVGSLNTTLDSTSSLVWTATFDYGLTSAYGATVAGSTGANNVPAFFSGNIASAAISGLTCGTTYHWSVVVAGTHDVDQTFATSACPPVIGVAPANHAYGPVAVGGSSQRTFTISNTGSANLVVSGVSLAGADPSLFALSLGTCASLTPTIAGGNNCTVVVTFSPSAADPDSATLQVASNAGATVDVALTGRGSTGGSVPTLSEWGTIFLAAAFAVVLVVQSRRGITGSPA